MNIRACCIATFSTIPLVLGTVADLITFVVAQQTWITFIYSFQTISTVVTSDRMTTFQVALFVSDFARLATKNDRLSSQSCALQIDYLQPPTYIVWGKSFVQSFMLNPYLFWTHTGVQSIALQNVDHL